MATTKYTEDHEWIRVDGETATVGITDFAQDSLGDIVFVEVPEKGASFDQGEEAAVVESVKAASEVYAPVSGEIIEANGDLSDDPSLVNSSPMDKGWFFRMKISDKSQLDDLMDEDAYRSFVESQS